MSFRKNRYLSALAILALTAMAVVPSFAANTTHVVSPSDLQKQVVNQSQTREQNIQKIQTFLSSGTAQNAMKSAHVDAEQVKNAVPRLSDQELANLAQRTDKAQADFAAGYLDTRDIVLIVLGVVVVILIVVIAS